jgi:uncharacterized protein (TIGR03067 family)
MRNLVLAVGVTMIAFGGTVAQEDYAKLFQKDVDNLQGDWEVTEFVVGGEDMLTKKGEKRKIVVNVLRNGMNLPDDERVYSFNLNPTRMPKHLDLLGQVEPGKSQQMLVLAIYELKKDTLKLCVPMGEPNKRTTRPEEFNSPKGSNVGLIIMKRSRP